MKHPTNIPIEVLDMPVYGAYTASGASAYLMRMGENEHGYDYLCVDCAINNDDVFKIGEPIRGRSDEDLKISECSYMIADSPLWKSFLFRAYVCSLYRIEECKHNAETNMHKNIEAGDKHSASIGLHVSWAYEYALNILSAQY